MTRGLPVYPLRSAIDVPRYIEVSKPAADLGFEVPVYLSRLVQETVVFARSPCACPACELAVQNLMQDRRERILLGLRNAIEALTDGASDATFAIDVGLKTRGAEGKGALPRRRAYVALRACFGPDKADQPVILIFCANEKHERSIWAEFERGCTATRVGVEGEVRQGPSP